MRIVLALALASILLAPSAQAAPTPDYPDDLRALLGQWLQEGEAFATSADREQDWWAEANTFLERAREANADGRVREGMFHLETFHELVIANRLVDEAMLLTNDGERKTFVLQRVSGVHEDAQDAWEAYRAKLHGYDGELHSLLTIEKALYSADIAITAMLTGSDHELIAGEFPKQQGFPEAYVHALVRGTSTVLLDLAWAQDVLDAATKEEGLPPRILDERWANLTKLSLEYGTDGEEVPSYLQALDELGRPARENGEATLAVAFVLAEQRSTRANSMQTIFGDASTRGKDVVNDAARGMTKQFNNTTLEAPRSVGLTGVFTSDAVDRVLLTQEYVASEQADLGVVISAWASLDHAAYASNALASLSPIVPPSPKDAPGLGIGALLLVGLVAALLARRR